MCSNSISNSLNQKQLKFLKGECIFKLWHIYTTGDSLVGQIVKNLPAMQETQVQSLSWEDPMEEGMATYSGLLGWRISWTEESGRLQSMGPQRVEYY